MYIDVYLSYILIIATDKWRYNVSPKQMCSLWPEIHISPGGAARGVVDALQEHVFNEDLMHYGERRQKVDHGYYFIYIYIYIIYIYIEHKAGGELIYC